MGLPKDVDPRLWVRVDGIEGRCFLLGNNHTFRGRICAYSESDRTAFGISKCQIVEQSDEAGYWIEGFLNGAEPRGEDMFGPRFLDDEDGLRERWWKALELFHESGSWPPYGDWELPLAFPPDLELPVTPWCRRVDEIWIWSSNRWALLEPQPPNPLWYSPAGSTCDEEGHDCACLTDCHSVCLRCGDTDEIVPDHFTNLSDWKAVRSLYLPKREGL